jgi:hypothetical protein
MPPWAHSSLQHLLFCLHAIALPAAAAAVLLLLQAHTRNIPAVHQPLLPLLTQHRRRSEYSGHVSSSSATRMTNMCARQRPWCALPWCSCLLLRKLKVPTGSCKQQRPDNKVCAACQLLGRLTSDAGCKGTVVRSCWSPMHPCIAARQTHAQRWQVANACSCCCNLLQATMLYHNACGIPHISAMQTSAAAALLEYCCWALSEEQHQPHTSMLPRTPASSTVSLWAAASTVSSSSQPPCSNSSHAGSRQQSARHATAAVATAGLNKCMARAAREHNHYGPAGTHAAVLPCMSGLARPSSDTTVTLQAGEAGGAAIAADLWC